MSVFEKETHEFIVTTNQEYKKWCEETYIPEALDAREFKSLDGLWAWQEQERRFRSQKELRTIPPHDNYCTFCGKEGHRASHCPMRRGNPKTEDDVGLTGG